jgi:hypothetical protein
LNQRGEGLLLTDLYDPETGDDDLGPRAAGRGPRGAGAATAPQDDGDARGAVLAADPDETVGVADPGPTDDGPSAIDDPEPPPPVGSVADDEPAPTPPSAIWPPVQLTPENVDTAQILHDRPDVFQGFFTEFYGPNNDHHSNAWNDRVGGSTPQDYANYWYETYGKAGGYGATPVEESDSADSLDRELASPLGAPAGDSAFFLLT